MARVVLILADGFEEVEAMAVVDVLRRAEIEVLIAGLHQGPVTSARKVKVIPDTVVDSIRVEDFDMLVLPGGQPGSDHLNADRRVRDLIRDFHDKGKLIGAICAAPYVLADAGILDGRRVTSYPSYRDKLGAALYEEKTVVEDGNILTSRGPGTALCFGLAIVRRMIGKQKAEQIREAMLAPQVCE
ncbi:MAG: DJ-1 family protein [Nitrospirae bacterium CG_4_9_14_3_um_filter_53_35]|nr:MAG: DJ-1 family protein [Nitrospirae bacterium CG2_30_53_67]PIS37064.1 MAG: DJ-1 family protein [Nitrospirae bacterium CG08_land_8_20_14_0_20_52_24]PIV85072.1 MAG: DJ-1 family protein [Nitrospirae bacterium CG17_big_fil_post_rev_8_21_14_2_50_50_9]PIW85840.1 MAG: DJ-1 family protein [Nitrospirae bacterium CG_4_8_14_3_um_filter_50_41]PIX84840.1 MAG: DJ-1 family protein [Nitrospirae bacterium CG_4_10_14_3_um_filter_53_41]PJA72961.1 MAG: DJ-1 family protein [Nitrospirae bacterium CG_4_9_14_3_u